MIIKENFNKKSILTQHHIIISIHTHLCKAILTRFRLSSRNIRSDV